MLALVAVAASYAVLLRPTGCGPNSHYALVRALDRGELTIDRYQWQACDKSFFDDHFYSNKAPGYAFFALPIYAGFHALGLTGEHLPSVNSYLANGDDPRGAVWPLTLWASVLPALLILLLVRRLGDQLEPGYGAAAAVTLGLGTLLLPFGSLFIQHLLSAALALAAFAIVAHERDGPTRLPLLAAAGAIAAYSAGVEYPLAMVALFIGLYGLAGRPGPVRRAAALAGGAVVGLAPLLVYNQLAFGSVRHLSYANQVSAQGQSGHDRLGAQSRGLYGVTSPRLHEGLDLLFGHKGLFTLTPIVALSAVGLIALYRRGRKAEAVLCTAVALGIWGYDTGFARGGDVPGRGT